MAFKYAITIIVVVCAFLAIASPINAVDPFPGEDWEPKTYCSGGCYAEQLYERIESNEVCDTTCM